MDALLRLALALAILLHGFGAVVVAQKDLVKQAHQTVIHDHSASFADGTASRARLAGDGVELRPQDGEPASFTSRELTGPFSFNELLPSWNVDVSGATDAGFIVELRVAPASGPWHPWVRVGAWGRSPDTQARVNYDGAQVAIDYLVSVERVSRVQYRIIARGSGTIRLDRMALCFSDRTGKHTFQPRPGPADPKLWTRRLAVPFRTQKVDDPKIAHRICSPTSVAMVMEFRGAKRPTVEVAQRLFDTDHDIYGNWTNAIQGAYTFGVPGYVSRCASWNDAKAMISAGQPLIISIAAKVGELTGAPYKKTAGHLLVLCGFDGKGGVAVNDPAAKNARRGQTTYSMKELEHVWLRRGGTCYVLLPRS